MAEYHGLTGLPVYSSWAAMHRRCNNPSDANYQHYGGRGIAICERWNSIHAFLEDMGHPPADHSIGRIDNDGNYEPTNCRWETQEQQNENTRRNRYVTWQGRSMTIKAWAKELDIDPRRIPDRLRRGWSVERTMTTPCPKGYEQGRADHLAACSASWAANGARYQRNSKARRGLAAVEPSDHRPRSKARSSGRVTAEVRVRVLELRGQGLTCRAIAELVPISKSSVAAVLKG